MKNLSQLNAQIAKQAKLVKKLRDVKVADYNNLSDNMMVSQAEYYIALDILRALKKVRVLIADDQATLDN